MSSFPVLWLKHDDLKAFKLMTEIMQRLKEREQKQATETVVTLDKFIGLIDLLSHLKQLNSKIVFR